MTRATRLSLANVGGKRVSKLITIQHTEYSLVYSDSLAPRTSVPRVLTLYITRISSSGNWLTSWSHDGVLLRLLVFVPGLL